MCDKVVSLQQYRDQSIFRTVAKTAAVTTKDFDGTYKISKVVLSILSYPIMLLTGDFAIKEGLETLHSQFKAIKLVQNATTIFMLPEDWTQCVEKIVSGKREFWLKTARRVFLTAGSVLKTLGFLHDCQVMNLGKVAAYSVANLPVFKTVTDGIFFFVFGCGAANSAYDLWNSVNVLNKGNRKADEWAIMTTLDEYKSEKNRKIALLDQVLAETQNTDQANKKRGKIQDKLNKAETMSADEFADLRTRKVTQWDVRKENGKLDTMKAAFGLVSNVGKMVAITVSVVAMAFFGWAGLVAGLTISTIALVADLCGYAKFATGVQKIDEEASIAQAVAAAA